MATTISSGRGNSPLLTANIADHGTIYGGRGLIFDGVTDYLDIGDSPSLDMTTSYTLCGWIKLTAITSATQFLFGRDDGTNRNYWIEITSSDGYVSSVNLGTSDTSTVGSACPVGVWTHVCSTYDGSNVKVYINGNLDVSESVTGTLDNDDVSFTIGAREAGLDRHFAGSMSDVKLFNTALTLAQVQELYLKPEQSAPSAVQDNMVAWYPMCEGNPDSPQSIVYDHSEKGLGSELITDGGFDDASYWSAA